ncbi:MAG: DUF4062 domain-containing protein [Caulobacteraceae bacterium]
MPRRVFISSVQTEFEEARRNLRDFIRGDPTLSRHFEVFLFEDQPAQTRSPIDLYLDEVDRCDVYVGLLGLRYGYEDAEGLSPTEREFNRAVERRRERLMYVLESDEPRHPKEQAFIARVETQLTRRRFLGVQDLTEQLRRSLLKVLEDQHVIVVKPFDAAPTQLSLSFINDKKVEEFRALAEQKRGFKLAKARTKKDTLTQLSLFEGNKPTNAAVLLFSDNPERVASGAEVKCAHYSGTMPERPALSFKIFNGSVFEQADLAVAFVMDRLATSLGARSHTTHAPMTDEIPRDAVTEAVVNALAHRDYAHPAGVQVTVYADRVEFANPGELPRGLTPDQLREIHSSIPRNPLVAKAFFLSGYMDTAGSGTLLIVKACKDAGLPDPTFAQRGDQWTVTLWRDWITEAFLISLGLNDRQLKALQTIKATNRIDNSSYQEVTGAARRTAARDLDQMLTMGLIVREGGATGRGSYYARARQKPSPRPVTETGQERAKRASSPPGETGHKRAKRATSPRKATTKKAKKWP